MSQDENIAQFPRRRNPHYLSHAEWAQYIYAILKKNYENIKTIFEIEGVLNSVLFTMPYPIAIETETVNCKDREDTFAGMIWSTDNTVYVDSESPIWKETYLPFFFLFHATKGAVNSCKITTLLMKIHEEQETIELYVMDLHCQISPNNRRDNVNILRAEKPVKLTVKTLTSFLEKNAQLPMWDADTRRHEDNLVAQKHLGHTMLKSLDRLAYATYATLQGNALLFKNFYLNFHDTITNFASV